MFNPMKALSRARDTVIDPFRREDGSVMVEAVIIMPILAAFYCASFVWFDAFRQKNLVMKASYAVSDVLSRQGEVDEPFMDNLHMVMDYMIPSNARPRMRVSLIEYNISAPETNKYRLRWSYGPHGMTPLTQADLDTDTSWIPLMADHDAVVVTETAVSYQPIFRVGIANQVYRNTIVTRPRFDPTLFKSDEPPYISNADDTDDTGDGDPTGVGNPADAGGDTPDPDHDGGVT